MKTLVKVIAYSENGSSSTKHTVKVTTSKSVERYTYEDLKDARIAMLDIAADMINKGVCSQEDLTIDPFTN